MTPRQLPERPNLEQLKKQAKTLLHEAQSGDRAALERFTVLPSLAQQRIDLRSRVAAAPRQFANLSVIKRLHQKTEPDQVHHGHHQDNNDKQL